jgi:hypothetical protein
MDPRGRRSIGAKGGRIRDEVEDALCILSRSLEKPDPEPLEDDSKAITAHREHQTDNSISAAKRTVRIESAMGSTGGTGHI